MKGDVSRFARAGLWLGLGHGLSEGPVPCRVLVSSLRSAPTLQCFPINMAESSCQSFISRQYPLNRALRGAGLSVLISDWLYSEPILDYQMWGVGRKQGHNLCVCVCVGGSITTEDHGGDHSGVSAGLLTNWFSLRIELITLEVLTNQKTR